MSSQNTDIPVLPWPHFTNPDFFFQIVWIFTTIYCLPWLFLTGLQPLGAYPNASKCSFLLPRERYLTYYVADFFLFYVIPLSVSCFLYVCIARVLLTRDRSTSKNRLSETIHLEMRSGSSSAKNQVRIFHFQFIALT